VADVFTMRHLVKPPSSLICCRPNTSLIVMDIHTTLYHSGTGATLTTLRQSYWIIAARQFIKSLLRNCVICRKVSGNPYPAPVPAPLPTIWTQDVHPITYTGVDFSGALYVQYGDQSLLVFMYMCHNSCHNSCASFRDCTKSKYRHIPFT